MAVRLRAGIQMPKSNQAGQEGTPDLLPLARVQGAARSGRDVSGGRRRQPSMARLGRAQGYENGAIVFGPNGGVAQEVLFVGVADAVVGMYPGRV